MELLEKLEHESLRELYFLAISLVLAFGVLQTSGTALQTDQPVVSVVSCSMYPQLHVGDVLVVKGGDFEDVQPGDIVVFSAKQVDIEVGSESFTAQGHREVSTPVGNVSVEKLSTSRSGEAVEATLRIGDDLFRVSEDSSAQFEGLEIEIGEVRGDSIPIVHRVIEKSGDTIETKGDNNARQLDFEQSIEREQVHGEVLFMVPRVGGLKLLAMDLVGFSGDAPLAIDSYPQCVQESSYTPGQYG